MSDPQGDNPSGHGAAGQETPGPDVRAADAAAADTSVPDASVPDTPAQGGPAAGPVDTGADTDPGFADRTYRSVSGLVSGVLLIALTLWLAGDAVLAGHGSAPWYGLAVLVFLLPLFVAFTLLPQVRANQDRMVVRNPFRTVTAPWSEVESIHAALSVELRAGGRKYQVWAIPVSLRQRKRAGRRSMMAKGDQALQESRRTRIGADSHHPVGGPGLRARSRVRPAAGGGSGYGADAVTQAPVAWADRAVDELRELASQAEGRPTAVGSVSVVWAWWIIAPAVAGAVAIAVLAAVG